MSTKGTRALVLTTLVVVTMFATPVSAAIVGLHTDDGATPTASIDTYSATDSIDVWERAALPFRASTDAAVRTVTNPSLAIKYTPESTGEIPANKDKTAVYSTNTKVPLSLSSVTGAGTENFANDEAQLVIGRLEPNASMDFSDAETPANLSEATDLLTAENANTNASWEVKDAGEIGSEGNLTTSFTPEKSGGYVVFLATNQSEGFSADDNGNLAVSGDVTIVGADTVLVEKGTASVNPSTEYIQPGESVNYEVSTPSGDSQNHSVILYDEATWTKSEFVLRVNKSINDDLDEGDLRLKHSIKEVNGVATFDGPVTLLGTTFNDGSYSGAIGSQSILDFIVEEANDRTSGSTLSEIDTKPGSTVLHASAAGKNETDSPTVTIETYDNWSTDQYRWVYVGGEGSEVYTYTDTIWVDSKDPTAVAGSDRSVRRGDSLEFDGSGSSDNTGHIAKYKWDFGDGETATGETPKHTFDSTGTYTVKLTVTDGAGNTDTDTLTVEVSGGGGGGGQPADDDDEPVAVEPPAKTAALAGNTPVVRIDDGERLPMVGFGSQTALNAIVRVQEFTEPPAPNPPNARFAAGAEITFSLGSGDDVDTIRMGVRQSTLDEIDASANELTIYHLDDSSGEWEELETRVVQEDDSEVIVEAPSAGFSSYAIFAQEQVETTTEQPPTTTEQPPTTTEQPPTTSEKPITTTPEPPDEGGFGMAAIAILIFLVLAALILGYLWYITE